MLELNRKTTKFKIDGEEFSVPHPSMGQYREFMKVGDSDDQLQGTIDLLISLGLKEELVLSLEPSHVFAIVNSFKFDEKKS